MTDFVTRDGGTRTPLPARSVRYAVCEAMGSAIPEGFRPQPPARPTSAAGADVAEGVAVDGVAADPAVFDTDAAPSYRDRVKHETMSVRLSPSPDTAAYSYSLPHSLSTLKSAYREAAERHGSQYRESERERVKYAEHVRRSRLSRWQETRG